MVGADKEGTDMTCSVLMLSVADVSPVHCKLPTYLINISSLTSLHSVCRVSHSLGLHSSSSSYLSGGPGLWLSGELSSHSVGDLIKIMQVGV